MSSYVSQSAVEMGSSGAPETLQPVSTPVDTGSALFPDGIVEPRKLGCHCDVCPLGAIHRDRGTWAPVPPKYTGTEKLLIIGEAPGDTEVSLRRPLVGPSWRNMLGPVLEKLGLTRADVAIANALMCQPDLNDLHRLLGQIKSRNRRIDRQNLKRAPGTPAIPKVPSPIECCRPHVLGMARRVPHVLTVGAKGYYALTGEARSVRKVRGSFVERALLEDGHIIRPPDGTWLDPNRFPGATHLRITPTAHPAMVLRAPEWAFVFYRDVQRWLRWVHGGLEWVKPTRINTHPSPAEVREFFRVRRAISCDIETTYGDVLDVDLRTVGFGDGEQAISIPFLSVSGRKSFDGMLPIRDPNGSYAPDGGFYSHAHAAEIFQIICEVLADPTWIIVGHNFGYFDVIVLERYGFPTPTSINDTILMARACWSEIPRTLYTAGTLVTDVPDWKASNDDRNIAVTPKSDEELGQYNGLDCVVNARIYAPMLSEVVRRGNVNAVRIDHRTQAVARTMKKLGMRVNQDLRSDWEVKYRKLTQEHRQNFLDLAKAKINIASTYELADLLYETWKIPVPGYTDTGDPSTDDAALRAIIFQGLAEPWQIDAVKAVRRYRSDSKRLSTVILPLRMWNDYRKGQDNALVGGLCWKDGRVHADFNVHCYDGETEILTANGWVRFDALQDGVPVAQWWSDTGAIDFAVPTAYRRDEHVGSMIHYQSESSDLLMTPYHRMPIWSAQRGIFREVTAESMPRPGGATTEWSTIHAGDYVGGPGLPVSDALLKMIVMVQADGHLMPEPRGISLKFRKARKIDRCREVLSDAGVVFTERPPTAVTPEYTFYIRREDVPTAVHQCFMAGKVFGPWVFRLSRRQIDVVLDEVWHWDAVLSRRTQYASTKLANTDFIQALLVLSNTRTNRSTVVEDRVNPLHVLGTKHGAVYNRITAKSEFTRIEGWRGRVYCVEVPSSWVVVRRNGKVTVSGNTPATGRFSSANPNGQNMEKFLRALLIPEDGHTYVGSDYDQIELRLFCILAGVKAYLDVFNAGGDPHAVTAHMVYQDTFEKAYTSSLCPKCAAAYAGDKIFRKMCKACKASDLYESLRGFAKNFVYLMIYGGSAQTAYEGLQAAEDPVTGELLFGDMKYAQVAAAHRLWLRNAPEVTAYWNKLTAEGAATNGVREPIGGRFRDVPSQDRNVILNFPIQGGAAVIMGNGIVKLDEAYPPNFRDKTGVVNQCHDAVTVECPLEEAPRIGKLIQESLAYEWVNPTTGWKIRFSASCKVASDWSTA